MVPEEGIGRTECFLKMEIMKSLYVNWNDSGEKENLTMQKGGWGRIPGGMTVGGPMGRVRKVQIEGPALDGPIDGSPLVAEGKARIC